MRLLQEIKDEVTATYVYEQDSYVPLARLDTRHKSRADSDHDTRHDFTNFYYFHCNTSGMPEEATDAEGNIVWRARYSTWGKLLFENTTLHAPDGFEQNLRMQGQYHDREIDLYYNTFRYYDFDTGRFTTEDPIGLLGGINLYQYAPNPLSWIDPWGWQKCGGGKSASEDLPQLKGKSVPHLERILSRLGFSKIKSNQHNQTWIHSDGSKVRIHRHGNKYPSGYKSGNNAHIHKESPSGVQLNDRGFPTISPAESHIGIKNPKDLPAVRGRPHGAGS